MTEPDYGDETEVVDHVAGTEILIALGVAVAIIALSIWLVTR